MQEVLLSLQHIKKDFGEGEVLCEVPVVAAAAVVVLLSQLIFGDVPLLRLFRHTFDVIGTENLHQGGRL